MTRPDSWGEAVDIAGSRMAKDEFENARPLRRGTRDDRRAAERKVEAKKKVKDN